MWRLCDAHPNIRLDSFFYRLLKYWAELYPSPTFNPTPLPPPLLQPPIFPPLQPPLFPPLNPPPPLPPLLAAEQLGAALEAEQLMQLAAK